MYIKEPVTFLYLDFKVDIISAITKFMTAGRLYILFIIYA